MHRTAQISVVALLAVLAFFLFGPGCSHDGAMNSDDSMTSKEMVQSIAAEELTAVLPEPTFVVTFEDHHNIGKWSFWGDPRVNIEIIENDGGNPGAFFHCRFGPFGYLHTHAPHFRTKLGEESIFTGDYRAKGVTRVGFDLAIFGPDELLYDNRPLSLTLRYDNETPDEYMDDLVAYYLGDKLIPMPNGKFKEFTIAIPSQSTTLPRGWGIAGDRFAGDDDAAWNLIITNVSQICFVCGDPRAYYILQTWDIGADNVRIWCQ